VSIESTIANAGKATIDEGAADLQKLVDRLPAEAQPVIDYAAAKLRELLVGRKITITIE
jgi:hypothetical protein